MAKFKPKGEGAPAATNFSFLKKYGLDDADAKLMKLENLSAQQVLSIGKYLIPTAAIKIPYFNPETGNALSTRPSHPPFFRLRYVGEVPSAFGESPEKMPRYAQPGGTGVAAYFPPQVKWKEIIDDPEVNIIITEGEFKAAKACKEGFKCIGLGGVRSWRSAQSGVPFLPELARINWVRRQVFIIFDSDFRSNDQVCAAIWDLAEELSQRGALVSFTPLPDVPGFEKTGLDDFLLSQRNGGDLLKQLIITESQPLTLAEPLHSLNDEFVYIQSPPMVMRRHDRKMHPVNAFKDNTFDTRRYQERELKPDGDYSLKQVPITNAWITWPMRSQVGSITYEPGKPKVINADERWNMQQLNMWEGWGVEPKKNDKLVKELFLKSLEHIFSTTSKEALHWFLQWCAYPIQHPGTKMFSCCALYGENQGTGKSLVAYTLKEIYGSNFAEIHEQELWGNFTGWAENKQFILVDDITGAERKEQTNKFKHMVTRRELKINIKFVPEFTVPDYLNYYFTSNETETFVLSDQDRRFFLHEVTVMPLAREFYIEYVKKLRGPGKPLAAAVFDFLLNYDLTGFDPFGPAFQTESKRQMISDTRTEVRSWLVEVKEDPDEKLRVGQVKLIGDFVSAEQLAAIFNGTDPSRRVTVNKMAREARHAGLLPVAGGGLIVGEDGRRRRYYAVKNIPKWAKATPADASIYLTKLSGKGKK